jgi:hypothetical protein
MKYTKQTKTEQPKYKSRCGSHTEMIVEEYGDDVVCRDERGLYLTSKSIIDSGLCDFNRTASLETREKQMSQV